MVSALLLLFSSVAIAQEVETYPLDQESEITVNLLDRRGYGPVALGSEVEDVVFNYYFEKKPEGSFYAESKGSLTRDFKQKGSTKIKIFSDTPGQYDVVFTFDVTYKNNVKPRQIYTQKLSLNFSPEKLLQYKGSLYINEVENITPYSAFIEEDIIFLPLEVTVKNFLRGKITREDTLHTIQYQDTIVYLDVPDLKEIEGEKTLFVDSQILEKNFPLNIEKAIAESKIKFYLEK